MFFYSFLFSFIKCSLSGIEEMFKVFADNNTPISHDSELYKYFSDSNITFFYDKDGKKLKISCNLKYPFVSEELCKLKNLEQLDLSKNYFKNLPDNLGNLINLKLFDISQNLFTEIPVAIFKLQKLKYLDLSFNRITKIPCEVIILENLYTFLLANNFIENITHCFEKCTSIKVLNLEGNKKLCRPTSDNPKIDQEIILFYKFPEGLKHLNLSNTNLHFLPGRFNFPNLLYLDLSNNSLKNLDSAFRNLKDIKVLYLENNKINMFPSSLYRLHELAKLVLCGNVITEVIFPEFSCINLQVLKLDNNPIRKLCINSNSLYKLSILGLQNTQLKNFVIKYESIIQYIHKIRTGLPLISMELKRIRVRFESLDHIGDIFDLQELTDLFITCINNLTHSPQDLLLQRLSNLQKLKNLSMENCGLNIFPISLLGLKNLETINLSDNFISEIPKFIKNLSVKRIWLERNHISNLALEIFQNPHIKYMGLRSNIIFILPRNLSKHHKFTGIVDISDNTIIMFGNSYFSGIFDIPYTMAENILLEPIQLLFDQLELGNSVRRLIAQSRYVWRRNGLFELKIQEIKEHTLEWDEIHSMFNTLKDKISDINLQDSTVAYLKKVYKIGEIPKDISIIYGESQRNILKNYIEEILKVLLTFLEKDDNSIIENCFILLQNAHNVCFDGQLEHLIDIHKILTGQDFKCLKTTICNILVRYKYEGLKLITTSNSYSENVHFLSFWRNFFSEAFGFENIPNLYTVDIENTLLSTVAYVMFQFFKYLDVDKIVEEFRNEINHNPNLMSEVTGFLFQLFEEDLDKFKTMVTYNGDIEDLLITGITIEGVEALLFEYELIGNNR